MSEVEGLAELERALLKVTDRRTIHEHIKEHHERELVIAVTASAKAGIGPNNAMFAPYAPSYMKSLLRGGGQGTLTAKMQGRGGRFIAQGQVAQKRWLVGPGRAGNEGGMLDPANFEFVVESDGNAYLGWNGADEQQDVYGPVHQGAALGGADHTKGHVPARPWMHFLSTRAASVVVTVYKKAWEALAAKFNARQL